MTLVLRKRIQILLYVFVVTFFFSCSKESLDEQTSELVPVTFNSRFSEDILTRAKGTTWDNGDEIGIFCLKEGTALINGNIVSGYSNIPYYTNGSGAFYPSGQTMYYPADGSAVDFISYYPYKSSLTNYEYPIDVTSQEDFFYSNNLKSKSSENSGTPRTLYFRRVLSKIVFNITPKGKGSLDNLQVTLKDVNTQATFSLVNGTMSVDNSSTKKTILLEAKGTNTSKVVEGLLLPSQQSNEITVEFKSADNKVYTWKIPHALERGKVYTYNIKLDGLSADVTRPKDYMEVPYYTASVTAPHSYRATHMVDDINWLNPSYDRKKVRNYSILFDTEHHLPYWVAYPMHPVYLRSGNRTNKWQYDPKIPKEYQPNLKKGYNESHTYARGHMMASADRNASRAMNKTTFYYTNMVPQNHKMNGGRWSKLEQRVRYWCKQTMKYDTLYVVTGAILPKPPRAIQYATDSEGKRSAVPEYMYKALLKQEKSTGKYYTIGFKMENSAQGPGYRDRVVSVEELEQDTGFTFFPNVPNGSSVKKQKSLSHWD